MYMIRIGTSMLHTYNYLTSSLILLHWLWSSYSLLDDGNSSTSCKKWFRPVCSLKRASTKKWFFLKRALQTKRLLGTYGTLQIETVQISLIKMHFLKTTPTPRKTYIFYSASSIKIVPMRRYSNVLELHFAFTIKELLTTNISTESTE